MAGKQEVAEKHPNREEMKSVVEDILMKVDLDTVSITNSHIIASS